MTCLLEVDYTATKAAEILTAHRAGDVFVSTLNLVDKESIVVDKIQVAKNAVIMVRISGLVLLEENFRFED